MESFEQFDLQQSAISKLAIRRVPTADRRYLRIAKSWAFYEGTQYNDRRYDWDGRPIMGDVDKTQVSLLSVVPSSFLGEPKSDIPWTMRRPVIVTGIAQMIVDRFTSLLFSRHNQPVFRVEPTNTQEWMDTVIEQSNWFSKWRQARTFGGATGTAIVGFHFEEGKIVLDVFDPRFTYVEFESPDTKEIRELEILYMYETTETRLEYVRGRAINVSRQERYYYRRVITPEIDVVFKPLPEKEAEEQGVWEPDKIVSHNLHFVPAVWVQNLPTLHQVDGLSDFRGTEDMIMALDAQLSQAHNGVLYNADPTLVIRTDQDVDAQIKKGSRHAIVLETNGGAEYLELSQGGPSMALDIAEKLEAKILQQAAVVLNPGTGNMTAEEVRRRYEAMYDKADILRAQYEEGMLTLLDKIKKAQETIGKEFQVDLPSNVPDEIKVDWPSYVKDTAQDKESEVRQIVMAVSAGLLPKEVATKKIATAFGIEDVDELLKQLAVENRRFEEQEVS